MKFNISDIPYADVKKFYDKGIEIYTRNRNTYVIVKTIEEFEFIAHTLNEIEITRNFDGYYIRTWRH